MASTPTRAGRSAALNARFMSEVVADNVRTYRHARRLTQAELGAAMAGRGHGWVRATVSEVERCGRNVTVDELVGLAVTLGVTVASLMDPAGVAGSGRPLLDVGVGRPLHRDEAIGLIGIPE